MPHLGLSMFDLPLDEAVYTFVDKTTGEPTHIAASTLRHALQASRLEPTRCEFGEGLIAALERNDVCVEEAHALSLPDEALEVPGIVCQWGDEHVVADGSHRLWRRWKRGDTHFPAYYVPEAIWRAFVIVDMPGDGKFWDYFNRNAKVRG